MLKRSYKIDVARLAFWVSLLFTVFLIGGEFAKRGWQPYQMFEDGYRAAKALIIQSLKTKPFRLLEERIYDGDGVTHYAPERAYQGFTLIQGWFSEGAGLRLIDMEGDLVRRWPADFHSIWPRPSHVFPESNIPKTQFNFDIQGGWLFPDGSVVFNFNGLGTVKMDKCGAVLWTLDRLTHHSITPISDGSFWVPAKNDVREVPDDLLLFDISRESILKARLSYEDLLLLVNSDGQVIKEISVLQALVDGEFEHELFDVGRISKYDPSHVNDIEVVTPALANKISGVEAGDLLVSMRELHMLAILDSDSGQIKWRHTGPWVRQHDPDITEQGTIEVFNNRTDHNKLGRRKDDRVPGSNIISLEPSTGETSIIYPNPGQEGFYTATHGTHQRLENGNRLITETKAGRVFEVDEQGDVVWEYVKPYDDQDAAFIEGAIRYGMNYLEVQDWSCP